jgi:transcriptional regulator with PAS, ATPase and Fis domain
MKSAHSIAGMIVTDPDGRITYSAGVGKDVRIAALIEDKAWYADAIRRRVVPLMLNNKRLILLWVEIAGLHVAAIADYVTDTVFEFTAAVEFAWDIIHHLLTDPFNAMTVVDSEGRLVFMAPVHERFFGVEHGAVIGRRVTEVIENTGLERVVKSGKAEIGTVHRMRGQDRIVTRIPIFREDKLVGAVGRIMFKDPEQLQALSNRVNALEREVEFYRREAHVLRRDAYDLDTIVGTSDAIQRLKEDIVRVAPLDIPVLILGESGTGKELVAHAIHRLSSRRTAKMVIVNSAALPSSLVESELFGYEAGSFTGADRKGRRGKFEQANGSSLFLDEIGDMPLDVQAKLLRVLQDRTVQRIGADAQHEVDFRLIAATNRDLRNLVSSERFRLDFYYRISPITLIVPPLHEHLDDIPILLQQFLCEFSNRHQRPIPEIDQDVYSFLAQQQWPGNIRQLRHELERAVIFGDGEHLRVSDFRHSDFGHMPHHAIAAEPIVAAAAIGKDGDLQGAFGRAEDVLIREALARFKGNKKKAAEALGISRSYLYKKLGMS